MAYPTVEDLVAGSTSAELAALTPTQQAALRVAAIAAVEAHTGQVFTPEGTEGVPLEVRVDGNGSTRLWLPRRLSQLVSLSSSGSALDVDGAVVTDNGKRLVVGADVAPTGYYAEAIARANGYTDWRFPLGAGNVVIGGVWGWTDDEYDAQLGAVTEAIRLDMEAQAAARAHKLAPTVEAARALGLQSVNQGGVSLNLRPRAGGLPAAARRLLRPFLWRARPVAA